MLNAWLSWNVLAKGSCPDNHACKRYFPKSSTMEKPVLGQEISLFKNYYITETQSLLILGTAEIT